MYVVDVVNSLIKNHTNNKLDVSKLKPHNQIKQATK